MVSNNEKNFKKLQVSELPILEEKIRMKKKIYVYKHGNF